MEQNIPKISTTGMGMGRTFGAVLASASIDLVRMAGGKQTTDQHTSTYYIPLATNHHPQQNHPFGILVRTPLSVSYGMGVCISTTP